MAISRRVSGRVLALVWLASAPVLAQEAAPPATGIVRGVVVDRADGIADRATSRSGCRTPARR